MNSSRLCCSSRLAPPRRSTSFNIGPTDAGIFVRDIARETVAAVAPGAQLKFGTDSKGWPGDVPRFRYALDKARSFPRLAGAARARQAAVRRAIAEVVEQGGGRAMSQAVILAGGKGVRLASRLNGRPKPLFDQDRRAAAGTAARPARRGLGPWRRRSSWSITRPARSKPF